MKLPAIPIVHKKALSTFPAYINFIGCGKHEERTLGWKNTCCGISARGSMPILFQQRATMKKSWPKLYNNSRMEGEE